MPPCFALDIYEVSGYTTIEFFPIILQAVGALTASYYS